MVTQIYLVRHGETAWSVAGQHTGRTDLPLTPAGEKRGTQLRERLRGIVFSQVLTSPLQRARQTCELAGLGATARIEPALREWDYGDYEGETTATIRLRRPGWELFRDGCPKGESPESVSKRADLVVDSLRAVDGIVAVFSHGHFLRALAMRWVELPIAEAKHFPLNTAAISLLGFEHASDPAIVRWNVGSD
jgi:probable phosphoglycerate mutase